MTWEDDLSTFTDDIFAMDGKPATVGGIALLYLPAAAMYQQAGSAAVADVMDINVRRSELAVPAYGMAATIAGEAWTVDSFRDAGGGLWLLSLRRNRRPKL